MDIELFLRGLILGFSIAAPVGPIGVLCIRRTLAEGRTVGFVSGLGAASADGIFGSIAAFGLTAVTGALDSAQFWLRLLGGLFLLYLGVMTFRSRPSLEPAPVSGRGLFGAYTSTLLLTLSSPATIITFTLIFGSMGLAEESRTPAQAMLIVLGVMCGSALWWFTLSGLTSLLRTRLTPARLVWVNRLSGVIIAVFGLLALVSLRQ